MRLVLIADAFPPMRSSAAAQLWDLSTEMVRQGHRLTVLVPSPGLDRAWGIEEMDGIQVVRLNAPRTKDIGYLRRTVSELMLSFVMAWNLRKIPLAAEQWDGVIWYSPTIFLGPLARFLKRRGACRGYLIVRDIFPEWAVDLGLLKRGAVYRFFKWIEHYQYSVADVIGVQTPANIPYFDRWAHAGRRVEVLQNWLSDASDIGSSISVADGPLAGRTVFVYAGNMGVAQGMGVFIDLTERMRERKDIGFLFVGRGSDAGWMREEAQQRGLDNIVFHDEIDASEIPGLYAQCHAGIVALDPRHKTHNIPGKFLSYMRAGLPVLARINPGNDLESLVREEGVGRVCTEDSVETLAEMATLLAEGVVSDGTMSVRCRSLFEKRFSPTMAVEQVAAGLDACQSVTAG